MEHEGSESIVIPRASRKRIPKDGGEASELKAKKTAFRGVGLEMDDRECCC